MKDDVRGYVGCNPRKLYTLGISHVFLNESDRNFETTDPLGHCSTTM
jgi:hypothetical protein